MAESDKPLKRKPRAGWIKPFRCPAPCGAPMVQVGDRLYCTDPKCEHSVRRRTKVKDDADLG